MRVVYSVVLFALLALIAATQSGCLVAAAAAGTGATVAYVRGDLEANLDATPQRIIQASKAAMNDLQFTTTSSNASSVDGELIARTATDKKVVVKVKGVTEKSSKVSIRIGTFGDEALSNQILDRIKANLASQVAP